MGKPFATGYIALARGIFEHPLFAGTRPLSRLEAWEWLIAQAAWKPAGKRRRHSVTHMERGQFAATERELAAAWRWPKSNVRRFLRRMLREGLIMLDKSKGGPKTEPECGPTRSYPITLITICNYEKFQFVAAPKRRPADQKADQKADQSSPQLPGIVGNFATEQAKPINHRESSKRSAEEAGRGRSKPHHGARGRGMVWFDHGTPEWVLYAADFREARRCDKLPENRLGGRGNWFRWLGEKKQA